jgi:hypothetical protein
MKTKEEILDKYYQPKMHWKLVNRANVLKAMDEYLERNAASFISSNPLVIKSVCDCTADIFCCRCHEQKGWIIKDGKFTKQTVL